MRELYLSLFVEEISRHTMLNFQIFPIIINPLNDCANIVNEKKKIGKNYMFKMCFTTHRTQKIYSPKQKFFFVNNEK